MRQMQIDMEQVLSDHDKIEAALRGAVRDALARHKRAGNPVAVWRDGKVAWLEPKDIPVSVDTAA